MIWDQDLLLRDDVPRSRLREVLAEAYGVRDDELGLVGDVGELTKNYPMVVYASSRGGDFHLVLEPFPAADLPRERMWSIEQLAAALQTDIVFDGGAESPFEFAMITRDGKRSVVFMDEDRLEEHGEYVLAPSE